MNTENLLELANGAWMVLAASLAVICIAYLRHEIVAREKLWSSLATPLAAHENMTKGMRVAIAMLVTSTGIAGRSALVFLWRIVDGKLEHLSQFWLLVFTAISVVGFLCTIREMSHPLYGPKPWRWTMIAVGIFIAVDVGRHFF